ncbi:hypothetical protein ACFL5P_04525 [candidate division KSB1 bacterium]
MISKCKKFSLIVLAVLILDLPMLFAQDRGGYAGSFLRMGLGARAKAMGGASVALAGDFYNLYYNPSGLPEIENRTASFSYRNLSLEREFYFTGIASKLPPNAGIAVGWIYTGISRIDGRDFSGNHTEMYSDSKNAFLFAFGLQVHERINIGIGGTYLRESLVDLTAKGFGLNAGAIIRINKNVIIGTSIRDFGAKFSWNTSDLYERGSTVTDNFPLVFTTGTSVNIERIHTSFLFDIYKNSKSDTGYHFGFENYYLKSLFLRSGIEKGNFTTGFGINIPYSDFKGHIDYAFGTSDIDPEIAHIITFTLCF